MLTRVNRFNLHRYSDAIRESIRSASFVAMDFEMTGVLADESLRNSRLDNLETRYLKARTNSSQLWPLQIGIAAFTHLNADTIDPKLGFTLGNVDKPNNPSFGVKRYSLNLWPSPDDAYSVLVEAPAFKFLLSNKYDFNLAAYSGIKPRADRQYESVSLEELARIRVACELVDQRINQAAQESVTIEIPIHNMTVQTVYFLQIELADWLGQIDLSIKFQVESEEGVLLSRRSWIKFRVSVTADLKAHITSKKTTFTSQALRSPYVTGMKKGAKHPKLADIFSEINPNSAPLVFHNGWVDTMHVGWLLQTVRSQSSWA